MTQAPLPQAMICAMMEPFPADEQEFNEWYNTEHLPDRLATAGFVSGQRFISATARPRYAAFYQLADESALRAYLGAMGNRRSPWTRRVVGRVASRLMLEGTQIYVAGSAGATPAPKLIVMRLSDSSKQEEPGFVESVRRVFEGQPEVWQVRVFRSSSQPNYLVSIVEGSLLLEPKRLDLQALRSNAPHLDVLNIYDDMGVS